jgi:hypothetical protein
MGANVELRFMAPDWISLALPEGHASGFGDPALGLKWRLPVSGAWDLALLAAISLPLGKEAVGGNSLVPEVILAWGHDLGDRWSYSGQLALNYIHGPTGYEISGMTSASFGIDISDRIGGFVEGAFEWGGGASYVYLHHGYTLAVSARWQLDLHGGLRLGEGQTAPFVGAGCVHRFR